MNLITYQQSTTRTLPNLGSLQLDLSHMSLGMCSELPELADAEANDDRVNIGEELADILWYCFNLGNILDINLAAMYPLYSNSTAKTLEDTIGLVANSVKRFIAYGKAIDNAEMTAHLLSIILCVDNYCMNIDLEMSNIMNNNINKLKVRFPEKFTEENALNRDLASELEQLKK